MCLLNLFGLRLIKFEFLFLGIFASLAALMFNCVRKDDIDYSPYDDGEWRLVFLFLLCLLDLFVNILELECFDANAPLFSIKACRGN